MIGPGAWFGTVGFLLSPFLSLPRVHPPWAAAAVDRVDMLHRRMLWGLTLLFPQGLETRVGPWKILLTCLRICLLILTFGLMVSE